MGGPDLSPISVSAAIAATLDWPADAQLIAWADETAVVVALAVRAVGALSDDRHYVVGPLLVQEDTVPPLPIPRASFDTLGLDPGGGDGRDGRPAARVGNGLGGAGGGGGRRVGDAGSVEWRWWCSWGWAPAPAGSPPWTADGVPGCGAGSAPAVDRVLVAHELTHAVHGLADPGWDADDYPLGAHTFSEGLAAYVDPGRSRPLRRGVAVVRLHHQQWVQDCDRGWPAVAAGLARAVDDPCGGTAERRFFGLRPDEDLPDVLVRFGYHAGLRLVRELADTASVTELLAVDVLTAHQLSRGRLKRRP